MLVLASGTRDFGMSKAMGVLESHRKLTYARMMVVLGLGESAAHVDAGG